MSAHYYGKFHPATRSWPGGVPESLANTERTEFSRLTCPHKDDRRCEYSVVIATSAHEFTLKEHLEKSCPLRPTEEDKKFIAEHEGSFEELVPPGHKLVGVEVTGGPYVPRIELAVEPECDCNNFEYQVCDICQGISDDSFDRPELKHYQSGMIREPDEGKTNWSLVFDGPMMERLAIHLTKGAEAKGKRNWMNACTEEDLERFRESAVRHFAQWLRGDDDEDHAAAIWFNVNGVEHVRGKLAE